MDKPKSKGDLRAAGKKRLEEFRQKKQQKGSSNKSSSTAIKVLADVDKSLSGQSVALGNPVTQQDNGLLKKADDEGTNLAQSSIDDPPVPEDTKPRNQVFIGDKLVEPGPSGGSESITAVESWSNPELVTKSISSNQSNGGEHENNGGETSKYTTGSNISSAVLGSDQFQQEGLTSDGVTKESRLDSASSKSSDIEDGGEIPTNLNKTIPDTFVPAIDVQKGHRQNLVEQKELVSKQLVVKAEQQVQDGSKDKSLVADVEIIQQELNSGENEKVQLVEEFTSSQKELQDSNRHLASELLESQEQIVAANQRASLLSEDLERAKQEAGEANAKFAKEMESMQNVVKGGQMRIVQLVEEMATMQILVQGLQDEKVSLNDDIGRIENELCKYKEELLQKSNELGVSHQRIQTLKEDLASKHRTLLQVQKLLGEKSELVERGRVSNEKLEGLLTAKEAELGAYGDQIRHLESEKLGLVHQVGELKLHLDDAREREEGVRTDLEAQCKANEEQLKQLQDEKVELLDELEIAKLLSESLKVERSSLTAAFDLQLEQLRGDVRKREEEAAAVMEIRAQYELMQRNDKQHGLELEGVRGDLRILEEDHGKLLIEAKIATDELKKSRTDKEAVELELVAHREEVAKFEEQNSNLVKLLEHAQNELQRVREDNLLSSSDLASQLHEQRVLYSELVVEKERLSSELQLSIELSRRSQQEITQAKERISELAEMQKHLIELEENYLELQNALAVSQLEMSKAKEEKKFVELQLAGCKEQLTKLGDVNKDLVGFCDRQREQLDAVLGEKETMLADHVVELDKFKKQQSDAEETINNQKAHLQQSLSDLEELKDAQTKVAVELETYKHQYRELGDENWKVTSEYNKCKDQLQVLMEEKTLAESMLEESKEMERKLKEGNALQIAELEDQREWQHSILEQKANERERLEQQVKGLVQTQEQMATELAETQEHSQLLEVARLELLSSVEALSKKFNNISEERDVLQSDLESSKRQLEELVGEKQQLNVKFEESLETWKVEKLQLSRDLEISIGKQKDLGADNAQLDSEVAELTLKTHDLDSQRLQLAIEVGALRSTRDEQRAHLVSDVEAKEQLLQSLAEEKNQLHSQLRVEREKATVSNDQLTHITEDLRATKLRIQELELETARIRVDMKCSLTQVELLTEEKNKLFEEAAKHLLTEDQSQQLQDEIQRIREVIASKDSEVDQLTTQCNLLQTELEVSNTEKRDLAQDLASLKHQLQQISEQKVHGVHELAQSNAIKQRVLGNEEMKSDSSLSLEKVAQDWPVVGDEEQDTVEDSQEPAHEVQSLHKLEEISKNLGQELRETLSLVGYVRLEFENQTDQLKKANEEVEAKQHQLDTTVVRLDGLDLQFKELTENAANFQAEKDAALQALYAAQEDLRHSKNRLRALEDRLLVLEGTAAALEVERNDLSGKFATLGQSHTHLSERALQESKEKLHLQEQVATFHLQLAEHNTELENHKDVVAKSNLLVQSLVQKLEDLLCNSFPVAGQEVVSLQRNKDTADYQNSLASRLHVEITAVRHQLQDAHMRLSETSKQLQDAEDQSMRLSKERTIAVETAGQTRSDLMKVAEEKEELETSLKKLEAIVSAQNGSGVEQAITSANRASEVEGLLRRIQSVNTQLENTNAEKENLQTGLAQAEQKLLAVREKLSLAVNKGKAVVQQRDAWKVALAEKSKELEMLIAGHQGVLQDRDIALSDAERQIVDLTQSLDRMGKLEMELDALQKMISRAEQVFLEDDLFCTLCAMLDNTTLPNDWRSSELSKKILWITDCVSKLLQELATRREEMRALMEHAAALTSTVEKCEARVTATASELDSVKHERDELLSRLEDGGNQFQLERGQMTEEKAQLTGIIRQLDLDIAVEKREKEDLAARLQAKANEIVKLDAAVISFFGNLSHCYEAISPIELDPISAQSSLDSCKYVVKLLIENHNLTVGKLKVTLCEAYLLSHPSQEAVKDGLFEGFNDETSPKEISRGLIEKVEEALASLEQQGITLVAEQNEKNRLQLELTQKEERLNAVREKLSAAVSKGKSLVQQRDSLKQALMDKDTELETLATAHKEELQSKDLLLQEISDRLASSLEHAAGLKRDVVSFQTSVATNPDPPLVDRLSEMERQLHETQKSANVAESEAENSKHTAALLLSDLELSQTKLDKLVEEVNSLTKDKNECIQQLESAGNRYKFELQELTLEKTQLVSEIISLKADLAMGKEENEKLIQDYNEVSDECGELKLQIDEFWTARAMLLGETKTLQLRIVELEMALDSEAQTKMKVASETEAVVARIRNSIGELVMERSTEPGSQLDSLSALLVVKYEAALQEVQELSKHKALLSESQRTMMENASSERDLFELLQQRLAAKDLELSDVQKKLEEVDTRRENEEDACKGFREEVSALKEELAKARTARDALQSELVHVEQKGATTREKLSLAIKKGKGVAQQRDLLKQSLSEEQSLVAHYQDELQAKESALKKATEEVSISEEKLQALEHTVSSLKTSSLTLEQELQGKGSLLKKIEVVLTKWNFPSEWQSRDITEKLQWLIAALSNAENNLTRADQERDALKKATAQLSFELADSQTRANQEQESRSLLGSKLEEVLSELEWSRNRIVELETLLAEAGGVGQQTEQLTREVLDLRRSVQQKQGEVDAAEEAVNAWVKQSGESEKYIQLCQGRISELEQSVQESVGAYQQIEFLNDKVLRLEEAVQQKEAAVKAMETSRGKTINKLTLTTNKFRELYQQSEGLVVELERMHKNLQDKDAEIVDMKGELAKIGSQIQISQEMLESKESFQVHLEKLLETAVLSGGNPVTSPPISEQENSQQLAEGKSDEERCIAHFNLLQNRLSGLIVQSQAQQADVERKEVQLHGMRKDLEEVVAERALLTANLQREQMLSERLKSEIASMQVPVVERGVNQAEEIEEVQVGKRLSLINVPTPHVRGARRPNSIDVAIDMDSDMTQSLVEFDDKGHGFKSLASSQFMPRGTRAIGQQIDRLCVAGGRVLMRQPAARLMATLYWLAIHIWMVFLISAAHI